MAREADLAEDRGDTTVDVDRQRSAEGALEAGFDGRRRAQVSSLDTDFAGDREEPVDARIAHLVLPVPEAGESMASRPLGGDDLVGCRCQFGVATVTGALDDGGDHLHRVFHGSAMELPEGQQARCRRGRERGAAGYRRAGGEHRRRAGTVVDAGHHHRVDEPGGGWVGQFPAVEEVQHGREWHGADQRRQVVAAHRDRVSRGNRECGGPRRHRKDYNE